MYTLADATAFLALMAVCFGPLIYGHWWISKERQQGLEDFASVSDASPTEIAAWPEERRAEVAHRLARIRRSCLERVETVDVLHRDKATDRLREVEAAERKLLDADRSTANA